MNRKVVAGLFVSLDGVVEAPERWHFPYLSEEMAEAINGIAKVVASTPLTQVTWNNSTLIEGDPVAAVKELKGRPGGTITLSGSISLVRALLAAGLLDELRLLVHPLVVGTGMRLFPEGAPPVPLELSRSVTFTNGVLDLTYRPA
ncbi:dihydrofolate reductase family protein [Nonomuraea sp. NPDC049758]|uniref:dihydrofolate reductase family protein n=1 Tax=Nonomuraea sp. NPDC049758 TaxID=3154360 RepID=UPI003424D6CA